MLDFKKFTFILFCCSISMGIIGCSNPSSKPSSNTSSPTSVPILSSAVANSTASTSTNHTTAPIPFQITMEDGAVMEGELYPDIAPITVDNFIKLASENFYDGLTFHRVITGFMIQGGDPDGTGTGGPGYAIKGEFSSNGVENNLKHERGILSMARQSNNPDSAGSQFFIMHMDASHLDGDYAAFGKITSGLEVLDQIASVKVDSQNNKPLEEVKIKSITITKP